MAMIDRLKDATRSTNSIEAVQPSPGLQRPADLHGANPGASVNAPPPPKKEAKDPKAPAYTTEPEAISRAYYVEDRGRERRYFDDYQKKNLSIRADDSTISTKKEDLVTIRAMLTMVEARGWSEVKVSGTADFKRETWIEAQARGIAAQGYKASDIDRQEADRRRAERGQAPIQAGQKQDTNEVRPVTTQVGQAVAAVSQAVQNPSTASPQQRDAEPSRPGADLHRANHDPAPSLPGLPVTSIYALSARNLGVVPAGPAATKEAPEQQPARTSSDLHRANPSVPTSTMQTPPASVQTARKALGDDAVDLMLRAQSTVLELRSARLDNQVPEVVARIGINAQNQLADAWKEPSAAKAMSAAGFSEKGMQRDLQTGRWNAVSEGLSSGGVPIRGFNIEGVPLSQEPNRELPGHSKEAAQVVGQKLAPQEAVPTVNHRQALKDATAELSPDGRLVLAALSEKIDRQMNKLNADAKLETKAFAAAELVKKEKLEGPVVLSPELRKMATALEPAQAPSPVQQPSVVRQVEPQPPQRSRSR